MNASLTMVCGLLAATLVSPSKMSRQRYYDKPFLQDFAERIPLAEGLAGARLSAVRCDRNGHIVVLSDKGLLQVHDGKLVRDRLHRPLGDIQLRDLDVYRDQLVYLTDEAVLSNAWAGRLLVRHNVPDVRLFAMGKEFDLLVLGSKYIALFSEASLSDRYDQEQASIEKVIFDGTRNRFLLLSNCRIDCLEPGKTIKTVFEGENLSCCALIDDDTVLLVGTQHGYFELDATSFRRRSEIKTGLPCPDTRCIRQIGDRIWFGTPKGAFALRRDGRVDYYASKRWLVDDHVLDISEGPDRSVLILSKQGLSIIGFRQITLQAKAEHFDKLTRRRHIRYGLNSAFVMSAPGDLSTGTLVDQDNDGLWTSMYLAGELFCYAVTKSNEALQNCYESFEAMERLVQINTLEGFASRSFERTGYQMADKQHWHWAEDSNWVWKGTTSSDEIVGHFFVYSIFAELIPDRKWRDRAVALMDDIMGHIVRNDWYLVDSDGKPTLWGKWNPEYVNGFPRQVGDRRLNSIEVISFLQATYHFTHKQIYRQKALELLNKHGYLENIITAVAKIGRVPGIFLTTEWNHSDDELAFLCYPNLYKYAFSEELREQYRKAIRDHWEIERPEKNPLWNFIYAMTGAAEFDLHEAVWTLRTFPLDTISWSVRNSDRKDLAFLEPNFRQQTTAKVLPPDERPMGKHNRNAFQLDGGSGGRREFSGDIYLLPYWMGRYLGIIR